MKNYLSILTALFFIISIASCSINPNKSSNDGVDVDLDDAISKAENRRSADPDANGGNTCLLGYQEKYDQLLTEEMVLSSTGFSKDVLNVKYSKALKNPEDHSIGYRFANKRIGSPIGGDFKVKINDEIKLKAIKAISLTQFKDTYRVISKQETDDANKTIDDVVDGKSESDEANEKIKDLEKQGVSKETTKGVTDIMKDAFSKVSASYVNVDGLGDAATWNTFTSELNVLKNGVQFELFVAVAADNEANKKMAIETARKILEKCN